MSPTPSFLRSIVSHRRNLLSDATTPILQQVRDRGLDHVVEREKNLRPLINIKNLIKSEPSKSLPISILNQHRASLMIPTRPIDFVRHYPSVFHHYFPGGVQIHPHVRLTPEALDLDAKEDVLYQTQSYRDQAADRLFKLLMLVRSNQLPLNIIESLKWDLGLPQDYLKAIVPDYPDYFKIVDSKRALEMVCWSSELATSVMEKKAVKEKRVPNTFPMQFSKGFEMDKKLNKWIDEWQNLPYVSPYENATHLAAQSEQSDKWAVAVLHEFLHILVPKKTDRENIFRFGECLGIRSRLRRALLNHPGIFYESRKLGTYTVVLREGYKRGAIIENHPLMDIRNQYVHLMSSGKEEGKTTSVPGVNAKGKKGVQVSKGENADGEEDESEQEVEGGLCESSDYTEVECDDGNSDNEIEKIRPELDTAKRVSSGYQQRDSRKKRRRMGKL